MDQSGFRNNWYFLRRFLDSPRGVGALAPSSGHLAGAMVADIRVPEGRSVIELGPGTGAITSHLLARLDDPGQYLGIDSDPAFVELLRKRYPRAQFLCESAERMERLLRNNSIAPPRYIVSGVPFAGLPLQQQYRIISALRRVLPEDAEFRMFQYVHAWRLPAAVRFRRRMDQCFRAGSRPRCVLANVPPALVMSWRADARESLSWAKAGDAVPDAAEAPSTWSRENEHVR